MIDRPNRRRLTWQDWLVYAIVLACLWAIL
jgi:hypothetical protein